MANFTLHSSTKEAISDIGFGILISREDLANDIWTAAGANLFTISGGNIVVTFFQQEVATIALGAEAVVPIFTHTVAAPYTVAAQDFSVAPVAAMTNAAIGETLTVVGTALNTAALHQTVVPVSLIAMAARLIFKPGIISVASAVAATLTATTVITRMFYYPMDTGVNVVAS